MARGDVSVVRDFYERYPYPPPVADLDGYRRRWRDPARRRAEHLLSWPRAPFRADPTILVAGCGTSQAAKHALRWPEARIVGIDVSAHSVERTRELGHRYKLGNLEVHQLPIERAAELATTFDQIVCTGVLHHLDDPGAGLRALRSTLAPEGVLHLMVYAPYGRAGVYMLQDFCRRVGIGANDDGIRRLTAALRWLPATHPLATLLRDAPDFQNEAALADALLHPQDRAYSVPELIDLLATEGFSFARWMRQALYSPRCGVMAKLPLATTFAALPMPEQYAAVELFRGTMVRHSVIAVRDDAPRPFTFGQGDVAAYVPVRVPDTLCVSERVPPGATGVLINRNHTFTDIHLPIDASEQRMFDAIDGKRTISELAASGLDAARRFFEALWWHDQVVFDAVVR